MNGPCPSCGATSAPDARFCSTCGTALRRRCPRCGAEQTAAAAYCSSCGLQLEQAPAHAAALGEGEERRVVTVLFADLAGSTALAERLDPEDVRVVQSELFELVGSQVERFGGVCEKFVGDAVLAVFGIPQTHEDDAERAVRAALAIQDAFDAFASSVQARHGVETGLRVGINTGEVVAGRDAAARGEVMVSGDAVNVAARLQQRAEPGQILVGERTQLATARVVTYRPRGAADAKGKSAPVAAWQALDVAAETQARGLDGLTAPLIGRHEELQALLALATRAERERMPQLVTLFGAAGVGKTRLLTELSERLPHATMLRGRCLPYGDGVSYWPIAEIVKGQAGILDSDTGSAARQKLVHHVASVVAPEWVTQVAEVAAWTMGLALPEESPSITSATVVRTIHDGWTRYVGALGARGLTVLSLEDMHWAPPPMLDLTEHLAATLDDTAVLLVCTSRPELLDTRGAWAGRVANTTSLTLPSLSAAESEQLVAELLGEGTLRPDDCRRILARAEGNPFFVEEILQMLVDRGSLVRENGRWVATEAIDAVALPDSVHGVIASRIDLLDPDARDALRRCAVIGRDFWPPAVGVEDDTIASLASRGLVSEQHASTMEGLREFRFKHALTRDVAYATLPRSERRALHRSVGEWIQHVAPDRGAETVELAAYHLREAIALGDEDDELRARAHDLLLRAGDAALARGATGSAKLHFDRALELAVSPEERGESELASGRLAILAGTAPAGAIGGLERALAIAEESGNVRLRGRTLGWISRAYWLLGRQPDARKAASDAVDALRNLPPSSALAWALARRSQLEMLASVESAADTAREAIEVARAVGDQAAEVNARINVMTAEANDGTCPEPAELHEMVQLALAAGVSEEGYRAVVNFLWSTQAFMPIDELERAFRELHALLEQVPPLELFGSYLELSCASILYLPSGRWELADRAVAENPSREWASGRIVWCDLAAGLVFRRGDLEGAEPLVDELVTAALSTGEPQRIVPASAVAGPYAALTGDAAMLQRVTDAVLDLRDRSWASTFSLVPFCRALHRAGARKELAAVLALLERLAEGREPRGHHRSSLAAGHGLLALDEGRFAEAASGLAGAAAFERGLGRTFYAACLDVDVATALEGAGEMEAAAATSHAARGVLDALGCVNAF